MTLAIVLFILTYALIFAFSEKKHLVALISEVLFVIFGILPVNKEQILLLINQKMLNG